MILGIALALTLKDIAWLAGDWQLLNATQCIEEVWTAPSGNMLVGMSRTVAAGRTTSFEFMRIEARENGGKGFSEDYPYRRPSNSAASRCGAVK
jgi:hypothetical protein